MEQGSVHHGWFVAFAGAVLFVMLWALLNIVLTDFAVILGVKEIEGLAIKLLWVIVIVAWADGGGVVAAAGYLLWKRRKMRQFRADSALAAFKDRHSE